MPYIKSYMHKEIEFEISQLQSRVYKSVGIPDIEIWRTAEPVSFNDRKTGEHIVLKKGDSWTQNRWDCAWFHVKGVVPKTSAGKEIVLDIDISGEACVFDGQGNPVRGLTTRSNMKDLPLGSHGKRIYKLFAKAKGGEAADVWFDAGNNDLFGHTYGAIIAAMDICELNENMRQLRYDMLVLNSLLKCIEEKSARAQSLLFRLYEASCILKNYSEEEISSARLILKTELDKKGGDPSLSITGIGHSHMDLMWLWPERETKRKIARTFSTVLDLMERYPDYKYGASQPQQYEWTKQLYPNLWNGIKKRVAEGRWEVQGAMWVEADTNVSGGEALVRQLIYGRRFFKEEFGIEVKNLWLPDVFGYSGALPQILSKSDVPYFMTQKLSWNEHNIFPHHTFNWEGIDGSVVLAHMLPENTYNGSCAPDSVRFLETNYADSGVCDEALMLFGIGDGGGGPGAGHLESLNRMKNLNGLSPIKQGFAADFFERINKNRKKYITYRGELYLEKHQGTYTTQANNKKYNRLMEINLHELEFASVLCGKAAGIPFPKDEIDRIWKDVLLFQFHDILPGSSIKRVYDETVVRYKDLFARVQELTDFYYAEFAKKIASNNGDFVVFNSTSWERTEWIELGNGYAKVTVPAMGYVVVSPDINEAAMLSAGKNFLENIKIRVEFNEDGSIGAIINKAAGKNLLKDGERSNVLRVYEDKGDCWDIPINYREIEPDEFKLEESKTYSEGPYAVIEQRYVLGESSIIQKIRLAADGDTVEFITHVDWRENMRMLRTSFETCVLSDFVTCNIQFGKIKRSTLDNNSLDKAMFEICAHKYIGISENSYGVALLNDCKYGYYAKRNVLDLNLLRSQNSPGEMADRGTHDFTYSIYAHAGNDTEAEVTKRAYALNHPLRAYPTGNSNSGVNTASYVSVDKSNVVIETVKFSEDGKGDVIIRMYEAEGTACRASIKLPDGTKKAVLVNLVERELKPLDIESGYIALDFSVFEIVTIKVS